MKKIAATAGSLFALWAALSIFPSVAQTPQFPQTLPPNTVVGRTGISAGPAQAIPFSILTGNLLLAMSGDCAITFAGVISCTVNDTSAVAGSGGTKWNPLWFAHPGTARVSRFNRIFCGEAAASSSDTGPVTTKDWLETLLANTTAVAQFACVDTIGQLGVLGASRSSDFRTAFSSPTGGAQGVTGVGYNNDTTAATTPISVGINGIGLRANSVVGLTGGTQSDMNNGGSVVDVEPAVGFTGGATWAQLATSGAYAGIGTANTSAAYIVGIGRAGGPVHRKGLVEFSGALDVSIGAGGGGIAGEFFRGMSLRWRNSTPTTDAEVWGNASGLNLSSPLVFNGSASGTIPISTTSNASVLQLGGSSTTVDNGGNFSSSNVTATNALAYNSIFIGQAPVTLTGTSGSTTSTSQIINASGAFTLTLPSASAITGRWLYIRSIVAQTITSASSNVVPRAGGAAGTALLASGAGNWTALQSDGANWQAMMGTP